MMQQVYHQNLLQIGNHLLKIQNHPKKKLPMYIEFLIRVHRGIPFAIMMLKHQFLFEKIYLDDIFEHE